MYIPSKQIKGYPRGWSNCVPIVPFFEVPSDKLNFNSHFLLEFLAYGGLQSENSERGLWRGGFRQVQKKEKCVSPPLKRRKDPGIVATEQGTETSGKRSACSTKRAQFSTSEMDQDLFPLACSPWVWSTKLLDSLWIFVQEQPATGSSSLSWSTVHLDKRSHFSSCQIRSQEFVWTANTSRLVSTNLTNGFQNGLEKK